LRPGKGKGTERGGWHGGKTEGSDIAFQVPITVKSEDRKREKLWRNASPDRQKQAPLKVLLAASTRQTFVVPGINIRKSTKENGRGKKGNYSQNREGESLPLVG